MHIVYGQRDTIKQTRGPGAVATGDLAGGFHAGLAMAQPLRKRCSTCKLPQFEDSVK